MVELPTIRLTHQLLSAMTAEADRASPAETGGVLLGYRAAAGCGAVVTQSVGPGPNATHERYRFVPDHEYQEAEIARVYQESGRRLEYLGDWHTHPGGDAYLSDKDLDTLRRIAEHGAARASEPVMLILGQGLDWQPKAWTACLQARLLRRKRLIVRPLQIHLLDEHPGV